MRSIFTLIYLFALLAVPNLVIADPTPTVSSKDQTGGVTAGAIGVVNIAPKADPLRERMAAAMMSFNKSAFTSVVNSVKNSSYTVFVDQTDPLFQTSDGLPRLYFFWAMDRFSWAGTKVPKCPIGNQASVAGLQASPSKDNRDVQVELSFLQPDNPVLKAVCHGLNLSPSALFSGHTNDPSTPTYFDYLSQLGSGSVVIALYPARDGDLRMDAALVRDYWAAGLLADYSGSGDPSTGFIFSPQDTDRILSAFAEGRSFKMRRPIPSFSLDGMNYNHPYNKTLLNDYEGRVEIMDSLWLKFLSTASINFSGKKYPVMRGSDYTPIFSLYSSNDLSRDDFWRGIADTDMFLLQLHCMAAKFAVVNNYAKSFDLPAIGQCGNLQMQVIE